MRSLHVAACLALAVPIAARAAGPLDGIYDCVLSTGGQAYVTVNGYPDGRTLFAVAAVSPSQPFYGYGIGQVTGVTFFGSTMLGAPFSFTASGANLTGNITSYIGGAFVNLNAACVKVWGG
jgi:hypothetical protein